VHRDAGLRSLTDRVEVAIGRELMGWTGEESLLEWDQT